MQNTAASAIIIIIIIIMRDFFLFSPSSQCVPPEVPNSITLLSYIMSALKLNFHMYEEV
jgi:hypothetical protein